VSVWYWTPEIDLPRKRVRGSLEKRKAQAGDRMEHEFNCPYCGEEISMLLDLSVGRQTYIEDCEVCCKPIEISFTVEDDDVATFDARTLG
jgi:transcription elongation factor Elf1